jgi:chromosome segregation ATPase
LIEQAMVFALGFFIAGLLALVIAPAFWRRAVRLSRRRLEMMIPLSSREIIAERDLLRAEFAVDRRKLEQDAERLKALRFTDQAELGRRAAELVAKDSTYAALEARHVEQAAELTRWRHANADARAQLAAAASALYGFDGLIDRKDAELMQLRRDLAQSRVQAGAQMAVLADFEARLAREQADLTEARKDLASLGEALDLLRLERKDEQTQAERLAAELADLRRLAAARDASGLATERDENAVLRQTLNELGAAIVRTAGLALDPAAAPQPLDLTGGGEQGGAGGAEPNVAAAKLQMANRL